MNQIRLRDELAWPRLKVTIEQGVRDHVERGFTISVGEWNKDINGVGVPFTAPDGDQMAFNCGGPAFLLPRQMLEEEVGPRLVVMVKQVGHAMECF